MLSKSGIERQIGKGINIVPFRRDNIKENSINFTLSDMAWTLFPTGSGYNKAKPANTRSGDIIIEPRSTTIVYTKEVIALSNRYGGTFHAKVGVVTKGVVFSSTIIGPSYCGHLLISLQNPTDTRIILHHEDTFISLVLHKLDSGINKTLTNSNSGGHTGKLESLNVHLTDAQRRELDEDWKKNISSIREKLLDEPEYKSLQKDLQKKSRKYYIALSLLFLAILGIVYFLLQRYVFNESGKSIAGSMVIAVLLEAVAILSGFLKKTLDIDV